MRNALEGHKGLESGVAEVAIVHDVGMVLVEEALQLAH